MHEGDLCPEWNGADIDFDWRELLAAFGRRWWAIAGMALLCGATVWVYQTAQPTLYQVETVVVPDSAVVTVGTVAAIARFQSAADAVERHGAVVVTATGATPAAAQASLDRSLVAVDETLSLMRFYMTSQAGVVSLVPPPLLLRAGTYSSAVVPSMMTPVLAAVIAAISMVGLIWVGSVYRRD
jgi:hypothetical protein